MPEDQNIDAPEQGSGSAPSLSGRTLQSSGGQKVIQPSQSFIDELTTIQAEEQTGPPDQTTRPSPIATIGVAAVRTAPQPVASMPPPTQPSPAIYNQPTPIPPRPLKATSPYNAGIVVFGAFMVTMSLLSIITLVKIGLSNSNSIFGVSVAGVTALLGIGIMMKNELARAIYVGIAIIGLVFAALGTFRLVTQLRAINQQTNRSITAIQSHITQTEADTSLSPNDKTAQLTDLRSILAAEKHNSSNFTISYISLAESWIIGIAPLVFLTRPQVKQFFHT